jgi:tetratricopeptide (TPR) repeat protein
MFEEQPSAGSRGTRLLRAAIVAHTDTAISRRSGLTAIAWSPHLATAERYVEALAARDRDDPVAVHWWFVAIGAMHAQRNYAQAMTTARRAMRVCGERPEFLLATGVTHELAWVWEHEEGYRSPIDGSLQEAEKDYTRALEQEPTFIELRVRLGRVQTLRGNNASAIQTLAAVPDSAPTALAYLARLFEGDALERLSRSAEAQVRYQAAIRLAPQAQSAQLALAYSQYQDGARANAAGRVHDSMSDRRAADDGDPWFWYSMGFAWLARTDLESLRSAVRQ